MLNLHVFFNHDLTIHVKPSAILRPMPWPVVTKTRNGKRNGMENGMKRKTKLKFRMKTKYINFVDTTAYKGKRFEIKQNFDF